MLTFLCWLLFVACSFRQLTQREASLASDLLGQAHQLIRASFLHERACGPAASSGAAADAAAAASSPSSSGDASLRDQLQLATGHLLRQTGTYSVVAMRLGEILLQTLPAGQLLRPSPSCIFDRGSLGWTEEVDASFQSSVQPLERFHAYCEWIAKESKLLRLPVWEMKPLASVSPCTRLHTCTYTHTHTA